MQHMLLALFATPPLLRQQCQPLVRLVRLAVAVPSFSFSHGDGSLVDITQQKAVLALAIMLLLMLS